MLTIAKYRLYCKPNTGRWVAFVYFTNGDSGMFGNEDTEQAAFSNLELLSAEYSWKLLDAVRIDGEL